MFNLFAKRRKEVRPITTLDRHEAIRTAYRLLGKELSQEAVEVMDKSLAAYKSDFDLVCALLFSHEGLDVFMSRAIDLHLTFIHNARLKMVRRLIPAGDTILDLGGANAPLYDLGYPHSFSKMTLIDLPLEDRHQDFQVALRDTGGKVYVRYEDMTELKGIESGSVDLVWSGQSIEHVSPEKGANMCREAYRVLKPGGHFCLDTPNRLITELHAATVGGGFVHPDHKIEYTPAQLRQVLQEAGFTVAHEWGLCEMPLTAKSRVFNYDDFIVGGSISTNIDDCYIQFFDCVKPGNA